MCQITGSGHYAKRSLINPDQKENPPLLAETVHRCVHFKL